MDPNYLQRLSADDSSRQRVNLHGYIVGEPRSEKWKPLHPKGKQLDLVLLQR